MNSPGLSRVTADFTTRPIASDQTLPPLVVGLYSFPKSGNTWLRAIIAAITGVPTGPGVMQKYVTDSHYGPVIVTPWTFRDRDWYFYKSHAKNPLTEHEGQRFHTDKLVHIHRHPLDVFVSYLNFVSANVSPNAGKSLPVQFDRVEDLDAAGMETLFAIFLEHGTLFPQNRTFGSVFESTASFKALRAQGRDVLVVRYEDLTDDFATKVHGLCDFLGFGDVDVDAVFKVADRRTRQNGKFFWKRRKENFRAYLTDDQIARFHDRHGPAMAAMGYGR